ncbi:ankyrin repeat domain-containing protein [Klebsiella pneumoniae]|uniref:ankyrin repeat domain-containing protein n=1 Tax=Klebsiella pneumoniae TaxID=573 RepID=UPI0025537837|nr:ankyrin repeat domain-containing protein [Klebsiella pneumoniae]MDK9466768.1 ankyrin repeat domain-containing protein [Klebsiella pneumoniae]
MCLCCDCCLFVKVSAFTESYTRKLVGSVSCVEGSVKNGVLRCLKAGMDINMCNSKGQTALFTCNVPEAIQAMIDADIDIHHLDNDGNNALFYAQNVETVELLVSNGINVNHRNKSGTLAIQHIDVSPGLVKYLIKAGLDIHTKDSYGNSFLFIPFEGYVYDALIEACPFYTSDAADDLTRADIH